MKKKIVIWTAAVFLVGVSEAAPAGDPSAGQELNIGYSEAMLAHVNEADAVAAIKTWVDMIKKTWNSSILSTTTIYYSTDKIKEALLEGRVDLISVPIDQFYSLRQDVKLDAIHLGSYRGKITVENLLLVHRDSGIETLDDLKGKNLMISAADRLGMGELWLDTLLMQKGEQPLTDYFQSLQVRPKSSSAVHGVFFKTADACLVTRRNFDLIKELNPQIGRELKVVEASPPLVPAVVCMRASYDAESKQELSEALVGLQGSVRGQQMLNFFNSDKMVTASLDDLASTLNLIKQHDMLRQNAGIDRTEDALKTAQAQAAPAGAGL